MSIELKDARHELDILEKFINNPDLSKYCIRCFHYI